MNLSEIGIEIKKHQKGNAIAIITDSNVSELYLPMCENSLKESGFDTTSLVFPAGEENKTQETYLNLLKGVSEIPLTRTDGIVALGGGVVGDVAGFVAATYMRGINIYQVPTTLLAQVDSSIGGKTGIDLPAGKNLVGAFHMPSLVLRDTEVLKTLPEDVFREGMAEVIKYGVISDSELFRVLSEEVIEKESINDPNNYDRLTRIIERCVEIKENIVKEDEKDLGIRQVLNFGHTIGHAIEKLSDYKVSHGEAVAKGMLMISHISMLHGWCGREVYDSIKSILEKYAFDLEIDFSAVDLFNAIRNDKKRRGDSIEIVIPEEIGKCRLLNMPIEELGRILNEYQEY